MNAVSQGHAQPHFIELLSFKTSSQDYAIDIMQVREIRCWTRATALPQSPPFVLGVINLRGTVVPVLDLARRLGLATDAATERSVVIVVEQGSDIVGLLVDAVSDILTRTEEDFIAPPEISSVERGQGFVQSLTLLDNLMIRVLNLSRVLPERAEVA